MTNIKIKITYEDFLDLKNYDLILKANYEEFERIYEIEFKNKKIILYALWDFLIYEEKNWFLYLTNWEDTIFQINITDFSVKTFESSFYIFNIYFYKNFIIIYDEIDIIILNENLEILKNFDTKWKVEKFGTKENMLFFSDENKNNFEFNLENI